MTTDPATLAAQIGAVNETGQTPTGPNYNVAPTTPVATVVARHDDPGGRRLRLMRWGLLPHWVKADADGRPISKSLLINARAETVTTAPAFRAAAEHKRCLVPMDGYYEWMPNPDVAGRRARKTPFYIHRADGRPLLAAGLWSVWRPSPASAPVLSCAIITTEASGELARVHDRMPVLLAERDWDRWLDPDAPAPDDLLTTPPDIGGIAIRQVSPLVNSVANNGPELLDDVGPSNEPVGLF